MKKPIIVIGAGICGVSTAIWLRRSGHKVLLLERSEPGMGTSYGNAGLLAQWAIAPIAEPSLWQNLPHYLIDPMSPLFLKWQYLPKLMPWLIEFLGNANSKTARQTSDALVPLVFDAVAQHKSLSNGTLAANWILDSKFSFAYHNEAAFLKEANLWAAKSAIGMVPEILTGKEVQEEEPICGPFIKCLAVLSGQGHIFNPLGYVRELIKVYKGIGGKYLCAKVLEFQISHRGIYAIQTDRGHFECEKAVVTAGVWSKTLMKKIGLKVPLEAERGYHVMYKSPSKVPRNPMMINIGKFSVTPMQGGLRCAGTVELGGLKIGPSNAPIKLVKKRVSQVFTNFNFDSSEEWMGFRPSTPDSLPLIGEIGKTGIFTAFGHQHIGMTAGPKTGKIIAELIDGGNPQINITLYDPNRYSDR